MIIVHAGSRDGRLLLWSEAPVESVQEPVKSRRRKPSAAHLALPLPYDAGTEKLSFAKLTSAAAELSQLAEQVREWQRPLALSAATPFRLCFRLEEPIETEVKTSRRQSADKRAATEVQSGAWYVLYLYPFLSKHKEQRQACLMNLRVT